MDIAQIGGGKDLILTAEVDVKPDVELGQYKGIEIEKVEYTVTDEDVEHQLEHIAEDNARWITIENRGIQRVISLHLDYTGMIDGEPLKEALLKSRHWRLDPVGLYLALRTS